jgi:hypothetical protein
VGVEWQNAPIRNRTDVPGGGRGVEWQNVPIRKRPDVPGGGRVGGGGGGGWSGVEWSGKMPRSGRGVTCLAGEGVGERLLGKTSKE